MDLGDWPTYNGSMNHLLVYSFHYLAFATSFACLAVELFALRPGSDTKILFLSRVDALYGLAAVTSLGTGLLRFFYFGKGATYYQTHPLFWVKMGLFLAIGLISVWPTVQFLKNRTLKLIDWEKNRPEQVRRIRKHIWVQMVLFILIPFVATALARGPYF